MSGGGFTDGRSSTTMLSARLLAPSLAVAFLIALIGCGGGTSPSFDDGTTSGSSAGSTSGTNPNLVPSGSYATTFAGTNNATPAASYSGTGTGTVAADGTVRLNYTSTASAEARTLTAVPSTSAAVAGSLVVGANAAIPTSVSLTNASGVYRLTSVFTVGSVTETDVFTLSATRPSAGTYKGAHTAATVTPRTNIDDHDAVYTTYSGLGIAVPTAAVTSNGVVTLDYASRRSRGNTVQIHKLSTTLLADNTFSGTLAIGPLGGSANVSLPVNGTWALGTGNVLTLRLNYVNTTISDLGYANLNPTVNETLALTKQPER